MGHNNPRGMASDDAVHLEYMKAQGASASKAARAEEIRTMSSIERDATAAAEQDVMARRQSIQNASEELAQIRAELQTLSAEDEDEWHDALSPSAQEPEPDARLPGRGQNHQSEFVALAAPVMDNETAGF